MEFFFNIKLQTLIFEKKKHTKKERYSLLLAVKGTSIFIKEKFLIEFVIDLLITLMGVTLWQCLSL